MIIRTHEPEKLYCKNPTVYKHRVIGEYPDSGCYVYEQDTSLLGPLGFFSWRRVNSLGSHSLFLGLNYPINQEITVGKDLDGREALFAMENCVYTASPRSSGANSPDCQRYSLQPKEGENDKGIRINFDPCMIGSDVVQAFRLIGNWAVASKGWSTGVSGSLVAEAGLQIMMVLDHLFE